MKIGLALGGGGVRGLAHIPILETLDGMGLKPSIIAGTSMGAIIGALYASGVSGREIRERIRRHLILKGDTWRDILAKKRDLLEWAKAFSAEVPRGGFISTQRFFKKLFSDVKTWTFEDLEIPLLVVAADYWTAEEVVFETGDLLPPIQASMAVPGVFAPVSIAGRVLVDGGVVNLVPYDHVLDRADVTIAVNVNEVRGPGPREIPRVIESVLGAFDIMQASALSEKMKRREPDIYLQPEIRGVRMFEFAKAERVLRQAAPIVDVLKTQLKALGVTADKGASRRSRSQGGGHSVSGMGSGGGGSMKIRHQYYEQFDADYTRKVPEEGFGGWRSGEIEVNPDRTALVVMHAWDCGTPEQYPGWFRACAEILETYRVCREVFPGLLGATRKKGMRVFHVVAGTGYCASYPGYRRAVELAGPEPAPQSGAEPDPVYDALRRFRSDHVFVGKHNQEDASRGWTQVRFPKEAEPVGDEGIAKDAHQLSALARDAGVNHLVYAGFNVDWCLLMSHGGMIDMSRRGYICSVLRGAVTAIESKESASQEWAKAIGLWRVSVAFGFVFDVADFVKALRKP